ncbi:MAG: penicillin-binding protein [Proteobacteria bacterium]|nr:penicillin-binding protein [Pseudomonadota bacterium]
MSWTVLLHPVLRRFLLSILFIVGACVVLIALAGLLIVLAYPNLPSLNALTDYRPKIPLRVYTADGYVIGEFGEERRAFVQVQDVPAVMKQAILAAEDERFYQHPGIDTLGVLRAAWSNFISGGKRQGASTITMQVARNFFLSSEKTLSRKFYEALLAFKIENDLTKDEILQLYVNQIYLGQRAYGFAAAAQIYYGKPLKDLSTAEASMLAGLPKAPSSYNPIANPKRAKQRQLYVLRRMHELRFINDSQLAEAQAQELQIKRDSGEFSVPADYVAEMARQIAFEQYRDETYTRGLRVYTTIMRADQLAAHSALRKGVLAYDRRHGYRGAEAYVDFSEIEGTLEDTAEDVLVDFPDSEDLLAAVVLEADRKSVRAYRRGGEIVNITDDGLKLALKMLDDKAPPNRRLRRGAIIRISRDDKTGWHITQLPDVEAAFVAASPKDGAVRALVGGFDFSRNKFNHVTQAWRQPGSSFKPFIYSAALEKGFTPASVIPDEPLTISSGETGSQAWEPKNYDGKYEGPMPLRTALAKSKNMVSIRLLRSIGSRYAQDYITRFGFEGEKHPPYLTMALGAGAVTPWQMLTAYSVFANGGYRVHPFIVKRITDDQGNTLAETQPEEAGDEHLRVIDARNAYLMDSMMHDVIRRGTATRALALKRRDLAGKTGTTNEYVDAWFCGYQPTLVGIAWIGFDQPRKLGDGETGGSAALPMWIGYMQEVLKGVPESQMAVPDGLVSVAVGSESDDRPPSREMVYRENADSGTSPSATENGLVAPTGEPPAVPPSPKPTAPHTPAPVEERSFPEKRG